MDSIRQRTGKIKKFIEMFAGKPDNISIVWHISIIWLHAVEKIKIQPNRDLLTLLTCHPYASGGRQRYVVYCERTEN
jgi:LPXTG-site transpeptidase (sortase) family protein